jgi:hypothetical protein
MFVNVHMRTHTLEQYIAELCRKVYPCQEGVRNANRCVSSTFAFVAVCGAVDSAPPTCSSPTQSSLIHAADSNIVTGQTLQRVVEKRQRMHQKITATRAVWAARPSVVTWVWSASCQR